jgi:malate/lactate dehydrogenase
MRRRVAIIGTGWVGSSVAISTLHLGVADELLLYDVREPVAEVKPWTNCRRLARRMHHVRVACQYVKGDVSDVHKGADSSLLAREFSHTWLIGAVT